jgi:predicted dehydrogenase
MKIEKKIAIVGCGLIGKKRLASLAQSKFKAQVTVACDSNFGRAEELAKLAGACRATDRLEEVVLSKDVDLVVVATPNAGLAPIALAAAEAGKHVLVEKPGALSVHEMERLEEVASRTGSLVRIGYNHRYHPAFVKAREIFQSGSMGPLMFIRARYGHGGRVGYEKEWRADAKLSGGGELMDQGVHLIDLAQSFLGEFKSVEGDVATYFWNMPVDDNAFLSLKTARNQMAWLHVSCTEWKNLFSFEIYGRNAKLHIEGLGGSYGVERLYHYQMLPEMGPPQTVIYEFPRGDESWRVEMDEFLEDIQLGRVPNPGIQEGKAVLKIVEEVYQKGRLKFLASEAEPARLNQ